MTVKQKILTLLTRVEEKTFITPKNEDVHFSYTEICDLFTSPDLDPLIVRLEEDEILTQNLAANSYSMKDPKSNLNLDFKILGHYYFKLGPNFHTYKSKLEAELNGSAPSTAPQSKPVQIQDVQSQTSQSEKIKPAYWITFNPNSREIILNDRFIITTPQFQSTNYLVFEHLYKNPGKMFSKQFLASEVVKAPIAKTVHQIVAELGFKGQLKDMFFKTNSAEIEFRPTVSEEEAMRLNTPRLRLKLDT